MEKIFESDILSKRERVERILNHQPVDRLPLIDQLCCSPGVIAYYNNKEIKGFEYGLKEIGVATQKSLDCTIPFCAPCGTDILTTEDGFQYQADNWTQWRLSRPFSDEDGAARWLQGRIEKLEKQLAEFDAVEERKKYRKHIQTQQALIGETVYMDVWETGFCDVYDKMGLEIFSYFIYEYEELLDRYIELRGTLSVKKAEAVGDYELSPVVLIAEDFCSKTAPLFGPDFLRKYHYPWVKRVTEAWHSHGLKVIYHSDGKFKDAIPDLIGCGVDGFYCLERGSDMHIEVLVNEYPDMVWMGGVDGINAMEFGGPEATDAEVKRIVEQSHGLERGGVSIDSSTNINPTIPVESYVAMVEATNKYRNHNFKK